MLMYDGSDPQEELKKELDSHSIGAENVDVAVSDDTVVLKGKVKDQAAYEKAILVAGNTKGISQVNADDLTIEDSAAPASVFYTVKSGDTLWKISEAHYGKGNGGKYNIIFEANKPMLTSPDKIYPGQVLRIPPLN